MKHALVSEMKKGGAWLSMQGLFPERSLLTGIGALKVRHPRVRDKREERSFTSAILPCQCFRVNPKFTRNILFIDIFFYRFLDLHAALLSEHIDIPSGTRSFLRAERIPE